MNASENVSLLTYMVYICLQCFLHQQLQCLSGEQIGAEPTLPYLSPELRGEKLLVGANFASAGIGILNDTGLQFVRPILHCNLSKVGKLETDWYWLCLQLNIVRISTQLLYFEQYQQRLSSLIGVAQTKRLVNQALVLITLGGNDFVNNYYLIPFSARSREFALPDYVRYIISEYKKILAVCIICLLKDSSLQWMEIWYIAMLNLPIIRCQLPCASPCIQLVSYSARF